MPKKLLIPMDQYLSSGIRIGSKFKTEFMKGYIYKIRPDGLALFDANQIDDGLKTAIGFLSRFEPGKIVFVCRRDAGENALKALEESTGIKAVAGRYPPGILTNVDNPSFTEPEVVFVCDPWADRNAVQDALKAGIPLLGICDTNNTKNNLDLIVPANNKGKKALGTLIWIIAKEYLKSRGEIKSDKEFPYSVDDFIGEQ